MEEAEFEKLYKQSFGGSGLTDISLPDTGMSEEVFNSLYQASGGIVPGIEEEVVEEEIVEEEVVEDPIQLGPAVQEEYPYTPPKVDLPSNRIVENPYDSVQAVIPPDMESALPWTTPKPAPPQPEISFDPDQHVFSGVGDIGPSFKAGSLRLMGNVTNLMGLYEKTHREKPELMNELRAPPITGPGMGLGAVMLSMAETPKLTDKHIKQSKKNEAALLAKGAELLKMSSDLGRPLTFDEMEWRTTFGDYLVGLVGQAGPTMLTGMISMGTASPLLLEAELNAELKEIPNLSSERQLRLAQAGGLIAGALEMAGLGVMALGIPKTLLGKIGLKRLLPKIEKFAGKSAAHRFATTITGRATVGALGEMLTEGGQEETLMFFEDIAREGAGAEPIPPEERAFRRKEALAGGFFAGGPTRVAIGGVGDARAKVKELSKPYLPDIENPFVKSPERQLMDALETGIIPGFEEVAPDSQTEAVSTPQAKVISPPGDQELEGGEEVVVEEGEPEIEEGWQDYKNSKGKILAQTKKIGEAKWWGEEGKPRPIVVRKNKDGIFRVAQFYDTDLTNVSASQLFANANVPKGTLNKFATEEEATEAAKVFLGESILEKPVEVEVEEAKPEVEVAEVEAAETAETAVDEGWQEYTSKGRTPGKIKKMGYWEPRSSRKLGKEIFYPIYLKQEANGKFKFAKFIKKSGNLQTITYKDNFGFRLEETGDVDNSFNSEEEALEALGNSWEGQALIQSSNLTEFDYVPETKKVETPTLEVKPEVKPEVEVPGLTNELRERYSRIIDQSPDRTLRNPDNTLKEVTIGEEKFTGEELKLLGAVKNIGGTETYTANYSVKFDPDFKREEGKLPQVEVKEEVAKERQPIQANPEAKEGEPGFKRKAIPGTNREVITPQGNMKGNVNFKIIELSEAVLAQGDLQGRKGRDESEQALDLIRERSAQFDPIQVTESARTTDSGPPTTIPSGVVISGNGRLLTIKELYENPEYSKQKEAYLEKLNELFPLKKGYSPLAGIKQPVLVQQLNVDKLGKDEKAQYEAIAKFGELSNVPKADTMSVAERAANDAKGVKKVISLFRGADITSQANSEFVQEFANQNVSATERGEFFTEGSVLSQAGLRRIQAALMTAAYGEDQAIVNFLESTDNAVKAITNAMLDVSPKFSELKAGIDKGVIPKDMDLTLYLTKALGKISELRQKGVKPQGDFAQTDFLAESEEIRDMFVKAFYHDDQKKARSSKFIGTVLRKFVDKVLEQDYTEGLPTLGEAAKPASATELLDKAVKETKAETDAPLFADADVAPSIKGKGTDVRKEGKPVSSKKVSPGVDQRGRGRRKSETEGRTDQAEKVSGSEVIEWQMPEYNASAKEQIFFDLAAIDDTMAENLSMQERIAIIKNMEPKKLDKLLRKAVQTKFGLKYVERKGDLPSRPNEAALVDSINNMINAYHNLQGMAAALGLPLKAIGLDGTLGLRVEGMGGRNRGSAAFHMASPVNDPLGAPYITIKYRFNAFAHEWGHALDYFLLNKLGTEWSRGMTNRLRGKSILDEETKERIEPWQAVESADRIKYAFGDLLNAMFQDAGATAAAILELEGKISRARTDESIKKLERQLEDLLKGMSKKHLSKSEYFIGAKTQLTKSEYYSRPTEMLARAFESYVSNLIKTQNEGKSSPGNEFIAMPEEAYALKSEDAIDNLIVQDFIKRYPKEAERQLIFEKFNVLFEMLQGDLLEGVAADPGQEKMMEWTPLFEQKENKNPVSKEAWAENNRMLRVNQRIFEKTQEQPKKHPEKSRGERWWIKLEDGLIHPWMGTKYGTLLSMMRRYKVKKDKDGKVVTDEEGNVVTTRAYKAIRTIFEKLGIEPGGEINTSNTFPEAVRREVRRLSYVFKSMVTRYNAFEFNKQEENDLRLLLTSDPDTISKAREGEMNPQVVLLAGELRNLLNKMYHYARKGKVKVDFLEDNAYLPRILDVLKVFADQEGFIKDAYNLYSDIIWIDQEGEFDGSEDQLMSVGSIANQKKFMVSNGIKLVTAPHLKGIVKLYKSVKSMRKDIEKMEEEGKDQDEIEKAVIRLEEYLDKNQDIFEEGYDSIRKDWSVYLASDWNLRIHQMAGEDPSASSPMANFTKKRVMPKEADKYMIKFYTDPIDAIGKYITGVVRKTEYTRRFGRHLIPPGKKRFAPTKQLQDYLDYLFREGMGGEVDPVDVQNMRTDVNAILGITPPTDMGLRKTLNTAHSYALMGMLTRAVLTSIPEPFVAGIKMRSSLKGLKVFALTLQEALTYVSKDVEQTVQKRRQIANILGLLDDPSVGEMASNRAGGTMMDDPKNQARMNLWFVRVGLQGLTNAQRRATMAVGFQYLKEMGMQYLAPVGSSEQAVKDNKKEAELVLLDLGIPTDQMEDFSAYMNDLKLIKGLPDPEVLMTQEGDLTIMSELLAVSAGRIVERSIQDPLIGNRPRYAEHPLGKFVYSIQSFNYSFQQNVIVGEGKHIKRLFKEIGGKRAAFHVAQLIGPIAQLYIAHALVSALREFLMNRERWDEKVEEGTIASHIAGLTVSRAGTFGAWDPMVNAYTGLRYQRDLSNFMIGAIGSWYTKPTEDLIKLFSSQTNSPDTTATEERAIRAAYQLFIVPMMVFAVSNPQFLSILGPLAGPVSGAMAMYGTSHTVKKAVSSKAVEFIYGSKGDMSRRRPKGAKRATGTKRAKGS